MPWIYAGMAAAMLAALVSLAIPQVLQSLVDGPLQEGDSSEIWVPVLLVLGLGVLEALMIFLRRWFVLHPGTHIEARMRNALYDKLQYLPVAFHDRWPSGQLLSRAISDLNLIRRWFAFGLVLIVVNVATIIVGMVVLVGINWVLGLIFFVLSIPLWIYGYVFENKYSVIARRSQDQTGDLATAVEESVHGIRVLKAFGRGKEALKKFQTQAELVRGTEIEKAKAIAGIWLWLLLVPDAIFAVSLLAGVWLASLGQITLGGLVAYFATATVLRWPVESIGFLLSMTLDTRTASDRFFEVMYSNNPITDPADPKTVETPQGRLVFDDVHFRYEDAAEGTRDLINGIDLEIEPGETMALVGLTGSGKSTITALTTRLYDVTGGSITIDGVDIRDLRLGELRRHIAMAFEDATLFSASVRDNVLLGRPEASEDELREAISIAQADFVYELPEGLDTKVGEEGMSLSGGQRQRLALARAVAAKPSVLVLDDPLSALDVDTEALVEEALRHVLSGDGGGVDGDPVEPAAGAAAGRKGGVTALIVAHRPSTVQLADRVALLERGRITAVGKHSDLLASSEHYRYVISSLDDEQPVSGVEPVVTTQTGAIPIVNPGRSGRSAGEGGV
ncbi:MAG TPA: ABC transporter ATP-binding protein [Terrimesophilobacter sp.]|nr:ABC transporter ATP-binding protein [Terrimesophilobacter sp.]